MKDGTKKHYILYESLFDGGTIRSDSALHLLCISIGQYDRKVSDGRLITLRPNLFTLKPATIVIPVSSVILLADIAVRLNDHQGSQKLNIGGSLMIALVLTFAVFGRKRTDDVAYAQMKALQGDE